MMTEDCSFCNALGILDWEVLVTRSNARSGKAPANRQLKAELPEPPSVDTTLRKTGIRVMPFLRWGAHICLFYETKEDFLDANVLYFKAGLESNEFCVWAISQPATEEDARNTLREGIPHFDRHLAAGRIDILSGYEWYLKGNEFDLQRITGGWNGKLHDALAKGYDGMRVSGNAFWLETNYWKEFSEYEQELDKSLVDQRMIVLCTYALSAARAVDILDVARAHQCSIARRNGEWEFLETPELRLAKQEIKKLRDALGLLSKPFSGHELLTLRERIVLAHIVRGASNKETGRLLGISPRTVDFHRANIMQKLNVKNVVDLIRRVLGEE